MNSTKPRGTARIADRRKGDETRSSGSVSGLEGRDATAWHRLRAPGATWILPLLLLLILPTLAQAQFEYTVENGAVTITGYTGPGGDVVIPETINGFPVTSIGEYSFYGCTSLTSLFFNGPPSSIVVEMGWFQLPETATVYYLPGTTGSGSTYGRRPTVLWNPLLSAQGVDIDGFRIGVKGTAEIHIVLEASNELLGSDWTPLYSAPSPMAHWMSPIRIGRIIKLGSIGSGHLESPHLPLTPKTAALGNKIDTAATGEGFSLSHRSAEGEYRVTGSEYR